MKLKSILLNNKTEYIAKIYYLFLHIITYPKIKKILKENLELKNLNKNDECFVFLTGRSLNEFKLADFSDKITFSCNEIARHKDFSLLNLNYYAALDPLTTFKNKKDLEEFYVKMLNELSLKSNNKNMVCLLSYTLKSFIEKVNLLSGYKKYYFIHKRFNKNKIDAIEFDKPNNLMPGVVFFLLSLAIYMGFKKIYLIGAGYTYHPFQWHHFYDPYESEEYKENARIYADTKTPPFHHTIKALANQYNAQILNVVPDGYTSPVYEGISVKDFKILLNLS